MSTNGWLRVMPVMSGLRRCRSTGAMNGYSQAVRQYCWPSRRVVIWDPLADMERSMSRVWRDFDRLSPLGALRHRLFEPLTGFRTFPVETTEDGQRLYKIALDLGPDFRPEDINVTVKDKEVTVKARRESNSDGCKQLREYTYEYSLPEEVNIESIRSLLTSEGQLTIEAPLPALQEPKSRAIPVQKSG